jgi:hypothetical protein
VQPTLKQIDGRTLVGFTSAETGGKGLLKMWITGLKR